NERRIKANNREYNGQFRYANNYIKTSKYSIITFLPLNLLEQFQRLANFYFLCLLVLQLIPAISSLTPITTAIPLIGVLALTAVKDAYDDFFNVRNKSKLCAKHLGFRTDEDTPIFISEHLTRYASRLYFLARGLAKSKEYKYCWTAYGKIYVRKSDNSPIINITNEAQVQHLYNLSTEK
ncbi:hypothetical protein ACJJTC_002772, partial [Scirpophaga incertulas]